MAYSIRGDVKNIFLRRPEVETVFLICPLCEAFGFVLLPSGPASALAWFHLSSIFCLVATTPIGFCDWQARRLHVGNHGSI